MEYTIQQAKDEVSKEYGYKSWEVLMFSHSMTFGKNDVYWPKVVELYASKLREADRKRIEQLKNELKNARLTVLVSLREDFIQGGMSYKEASEASRQHHRILAIDKALNL